MLLFLSTGMIIADLKHAGTVAVCRVKRPVEDVSEYGSKLWDGKGKVPIPQRVRESTCLGTIVLKTAEKVIKSLWQGEVTVKNVMFCLVVITCRPCQTTLML